MNEMYLCINLLPPYSLRSQGDKNKTKAQKTQYLKKYKYFLELEDESIVFKINIHIYLGLI